MPTLNVVVQTSPELSMRARQVCGMFDCPPEKKQRLEWKAELPLDEKPWSIGLIVGPSGSGKSVCAKSLWPDEMQYVPEWSGKSVIDSFGEHPLESVTSALSSVGFSTIPAWLRPFEVLSNGERFRAEIARRMLDQQGTIVVDEFTSVVDRQVAKVACHAIQKFIRKQERQLVAVTCHNDVIDWLQPDWVFEPAERAFRWRLLRRRPEIQVEISQLPYEAWSLFAPYHYMSAELNKAAKCYGLWTDGELASFTAVLHRPHPKAKNIKGFARGVTLPDYQGLGLFFVLMETIAAAHKAVGFRSRFYPAHPAFIRAARPESWRCDKKPGTYLGTKRGPNAADHCKSVHHARPCATFEYIGPAMEDKEAARRLIGQRYAN